MKKLLIATLMFFATMIVHGQSKGNRYLKINPNIPLSHKDSTAWGLTTPIDTAKIRKLLISGEWSRYSDLHVVIRDTNNKRLVEANFGINLNPDSLQIKGDTMLLIKKLANDYMLYNAKYYKAKDVLDMLNLDCFSSLMTDAFKEELRKRLYSYDSIKHIYK